MGGKKAKGEGAPERAPESVEKMSARLRQDAVAAQLDEEHREDYLATRDYLSAIADKLVRGEPLGEQDRCCAAACVLLLVEQLPQERKRPRGKQPEFVHWEAAWLFRAFTGLGGFTHERARQYLADRYSVTEEAIRQAVERHPEP